MSKTSSFKKIKRKARKVKVSFKASNGETITFWKRVRVPQHIKVTFYARKKKNELRKNQSGIIYVLATIVVFLFVGGFVGFTLWAIMTPIGETVTPIANSYHNSTWPLYNQLGFAETFMANFWKYLIAMGLLFVLALWVYMYSQHRGQAY